MQEGIDSERIITQKKPKPKGFIGKWVNNAYNGIKSGIGKVSSWVGNSMIGKAGKWVWENKTPILGAAGGIMSGIGTITGNPVLIAGGAGLSNVANAIKEGEAKKALQKVIDERNPNPLGSNISYSDMPRIHYSSKPTVRVKQSAINNSVLLDKIKELMKGNKKK